MRFQRKNDAFPEFPDSGLSRAESGPDVPRWLGVLGLVAGAALLVALVRYAIDLLGVVFLIILVGFAIRAVSDWLTEGESISGWAMTAVFLGLIGTALVGLWLSNSRDLSGSRIRLPGPVERSVAWLEERGWGQRVLLPGRPGLGSGSAGALGGTPGASSGTASSGPSSTDPVSQPPSRPITEIARRGRTARPRGPSSGAVAAGSASTAAAAPAVAESAVPVATRLTLSAPASSVVGRLVRLVASVESDGSARAPGGRVVFYADGAEIGRATVRGGTAVLSTLALELGAHQLSASYEGDEWHLAGASASVGHMVQRQ